MIAVFRVDASIQMGTGHVMRCLSLADQLRKWNFVVRFICRELEGNLIPYIRNKGYEVFQLPAVDEPVRNASIGTPPHASWLEVPWYVDAEQTLERLQQQPETIDWFIIDHYAIDDRYEKMVSRYVGKVMVIDDLADRPHCCDLLLDQNYYEDMTVRYRELVPSSCLTRLGPSYAILRNEFHEAKAAASRREGTIQSILVSFGGVDLSGETMKVLQAIQTMEGKRPNVEVIMGKMNPYTDQIIELSRQIPNVTCYDHVDTMTQFMARADLAIGSGGTTTWERCCLGLPSLVISTAFNQQRLSEHIAKTQAIRYLGKSIDVTSQIIRKHVEELMNDHEACLDMALRASALVDGFGTYRVVKELAG